MQRLSETGASLQVHVGNSNHILNQTYIKPSQEKHVEDLDFAMNLGVYADSQRIGQRFEFPNRTWNSQSVEQVEVRCQDRQLPRDKEEK